MYNIRRGHLFALLSLTDWTEFGGSQTRWLMKSIGFDLGQCQKLVDTPHEDGKMIFICCNIQPKEKGEIYISLVTILDDIWDCQLCNKTNASETADDAGM